ncbi:hypothetical protein BGZ59_008623 [Podila verticillata]|nr:hypothetical protein BGZ59_008623 [Podila verticillata]KFH69237.1 hypothetical protein MVEG_04052 [Podila verticillata NRRL 6337]
MTSNPRIDIPEILGSIGEYLASQDLAKCVRVSRLWFLVLTPVLWRTVRVFDFAYIMNKSLDTDKYAWDDPGQTICKYNHLIRSITTRSHKTLKDITPNCTQLAFLELDFKFIGPTHSRKVHAWNLYTHKYRQDSVAILTTLIRQNMNLRTVHLCLGADDSFEMILDSLGELQGLEELILSDFLLDQRLKDLKMVLSRCRHLKRFAYGSTLDTMKGLFSPEEHLNKDFRQELGHLTIGDHESGIEQLILVHNIVWQRNTPSILESCPKLWSLRLQYLNPMDHFGIDAVIRQHCHYIQDLQLTVGELAAHLLDDILQAIVQLTTLTLEYSAMTAHSLRTLIAYHGPHLRRVSLLRGMSTIERGQAIVQILQSCPHLESFVSDHPIHGSRLVGLWPRTASPTISDAALWPLNLKRLSLCVVKEYRSTHSRIPGRGAASVTGTSSAEHQWDVLDVLSRRTLLGRNLVFVELIRPPVTKQMMQYDRIEWDEDLVLDFLRRAKELVEIVVEGLSLRTRR